jgi:hypothetical protein
MNCREQLISLLQSDPKSSLISQLIQEFELISNVDLEFDVSLLKGVWELRWSSSTQPWLKQKPWLENLQILDPEQKKGINLLRLSAPIGSVAGIAVEAELSINGSNQVGVQFKKGGWLGPSLRNGWRPKLLTTINQSFPAWLDITGLDDTLRICRGNAGTCFALVKRRDLAVTNWIPAPPRTI